MLEKRMRIYSTARINHSVLDDQNKQLTGSIKNEDKAKLLREDPDTWK